MTLITIVHTAYEIQPCVVATLRSTQLREQALEEAFTATQNLETSWVASCGQRGITATPTAEIRQRGGCRSTSMGDYARVVDAAGQETYWRCCALGWRAIDSLHQLTLVGEAAICAGLAR